MRFLICLIIYSLISVAATAQLKFHLVHYSDENGLPQNSINFISADNAGFIWLATEDGLVRFDGYHFKTSGNEELQTTSSRFRAFYRDGSRLYCHTAKYEQIEISDGKALLNRNVSSWLQYQIDLTVQPRGIFKRNFQEADRFFDNGTINMNNDDMQAYKDVYILKGGDSLYHYNGHQIAIYNKRRVVDTFAFHTSRDWKFFILKDRLYSIGPGAAFTDFTTGNLTKVHLKGDICTAPSYRNGNASPFLLWNISVSDQVILYLDKSFFLATLAADGSIYTKLLFQGFDAPGKNICSAYYDNHSGVLFLGSSTKGLYTLSPKKFKTIASDFGENIYYGQIEYQPDKILTIGPRTVDLTGRHAGFSTRDDLNPMTFFSMIKDALSGNIWSIWHEQLYSLSSKTLRKLKSWTLPLPINVLCQDSANKLWMGTINGELYGKLPKEQAPVLYGRFPGRISYILPLTNGELYVGTEDGLYKFRLSDGVKKLITGLENKSIRSVFKSNSGDVWVTTYGNGFYYLDNDHAVNLPIDVNGYLRSPHYFVEDLRGYFWIPTNKGLFQVSKKDLLSYVHHKTYNRPPPYYYYYDKTNGFNTNEFNGGCEPCAIKLNNNLVSMPSMNGLVLFNPDSIQPLLPQKGLYIDQIIMDSVNIGTDDLMELPEDFNQLNISVSTPFLGDHRNLQMVYSLVSDNKADTTWLPLASNRVISLSVLPSGSYDLIIRKTNGFGRANYIEKKLHITVHAKWYHSLWFGLALILLLPFLGIIIGNSRSKYIARKNKQLEAIIEDKTRNLKKRANMQDLIIKAIGHDIRTPLKYHILLSNKINEQALKENASLAHRTEILNASSKQIYQLVENFVHYLKIQNATPVYRKQNIILNKVVNEKLDFFHSIAERRSNVLLSIGTIEVVAVTDPQLLAIIIHNLIDNALKVVQNGLVTLEVGLSILKRPFITVTDSGPGLDPQILEWLNDSGMVDDKNQDIMPLRGGLGLLMIKQLADLLNITIHARAVTDRGTVITLLFEKRVRYS